MIRATTLPEKAFLKVMNLNNSTEVVKELQQHFCDDSLLLAYGPTNDEQGLVRDIHKAAGQAQGEVKWQLHRVAAYNVYEACKRLKQAHDRKYNPHRVDGASKKGSYGLDSMHKFFVGATGRRFVRPLPEGTASQLVA